MADPTPVVPPAPEGKPSAPAPAPAAVPPILAPRKGAGRVWGIVDLLLLLAIAGGAAFYALKETLFRHQAVVVDRPVGPLTRVKDGAAPVVSTTPAP